MADEKKSQWGCKRCGRKDTTGTHLDDAQRRVMRNCDRISNPKIGRCPWSRIDMATKALVAIWSKWKILGGNALEMLGPHVEAITICEGELRTIESESLRSKKASTKNGSSD